MSNHARNQPQADVLELVSDEAQLNKLIELQDKYDNSCKKIISTSPARVSFNLAKNLLSIAKLKVTASRQNIVIYF